MSKNIEKILKLGMDIDKEARAAAEAIEALRERYGDDIDLMGEFAGDLTYMQKKRTAIEEMVSALEDPLIRKVFTARYLHKLGWQEVADACYISPAHAHRLHKAGLATLVPTNL
ncbi:MAG: hypothetical protein LBE35_02590 [Clostridiales bacterium]|jgi:L-alanine-DL-glutamate epimerase-like enolase superfamily enzyme|nr:hypothetical protein [Clostridiales bacterium]